MAFSLVFNPSTGDPLLLPEDFGSPEQILGVKAKFAKALIDMDGVRKNANNPQFKTKYANLAAVEEAIGKSLDKFGISMSSTEIGLSTERIKIAFIVTDSESGASFVAGFSTSYKPTKADAQGTAGAETYAIRRGKLALCSLPTEDDDGKSASAQPSHHERPSIALPAVSSIAGVVRPPGM